MNNRISLLFVAFLFSYNINAQLFCPDDVTASCFSDLSISEFGNATVLSGNYYQSQVKYEDDNQTNACNSGQVFRRFYIDTNNNNEFTEGEPYCIQTITLTYNPLPLNIQFPSEVTLNCLDDLPSQSPTWSHHPCDMVGYTYEDEVFDFENGACQKVVRTFKVINWCEYDGNDGEGLYTGIQIIKIVDNEAPEIENCEDIVFDAVENCQAEVVLTNSASDIGDCPSGRLQWTLSVDLWGDGTEDLFFGPNEPQPFRIDRVENGEEVSVTLPDLLEISNNKIEWKVTDGCGNVRSCSSSFEVLDNKPPTPYCLNFLSATLNGQDNGQLVIPVSLFGNGSFDNCSSEDEITLSFSENVEDQERVIECGEIGFQFYRIFHTDGAGNQDFCEVFMFVLDNGSCAGRFEPIGRVYKRNGEAVEGVSTYLMEGTEMIYQSLSNSTGNFDFGEQSLMDTYYAKAEKSENPMLGVDLVDYQMMVDAALGKINLDYHTRIAADMNEDGQFSIADLEIFRSVLTGEVELTEEESLKFIPESTQNLSLGAAYNPEMSIMDYQTGFNFLQIKKGDLVETVENDGETIESVTLDFVIENDQVVISNPEAFKTGFFSIDLFTEKENIENQLGASTTYEDDLSTKVINLKEESLVINPNELHLAITIDSKEESQALLSTLIGEVSFINTQSDGLVEVEWNIIDKRSKEENSSIDVVEISIYLTVFNNEINVIGDNIKDIYMRSVSGHLIDHTAIRENDRVVLTIEDALSHGVYFLEIETDQGFQVKKVVK